MKKKHTLLLLCLCFILLMAAAWLLYHWLSRQSTPNTLGTTTPSASATVPGQSAPQPDQSGQTDASAPDHPVQAPDFTVLDAQGNQVKLSDYFGKPIVLNFWASWCGPCKSEMPDFDAAYAELKDSVHFLMVNMTTSSQETRENASKYVSNSGYSFPVFYDTQGEAATVYNVWSLPTTYFIDADGYPVAYANSAIDRQLLQTGIDMILNPD